MAQGAARQNEPDQAAIDAVNLSRIRTAQDALSSETGALRSTFAKAEAQGLHLPAAKRDLKTRDRKSPSALPSPTLKPYPKEKLSKPQAERYSGAEGHEPVSLPERPPKCLSVASGSSTGCWSFIATRIHLHGMRASF